MVLINKMARRCALRGSTSLGFYTEFGDTSDEMSSGGKFYEVERLVDRKIRRVSFGISSKLNSFDLIMPGLCLLLSAVERVQKGRSYLG